MKKEQKQTRWTDSETQRLRDLWPTQSLRELAGSLGRSRDSVRERAKRLGLPSKEVQGAPVEPLADFWKREATDAKRKLAEAVRERTATDLLVERAVELAPIGYRPVSGRMFTQRKSGGSPQSALLMFSDAHVGQIISPDQTLELGEYNFEIFLRRLKQLERAVTSIIQDHVTTPVPEIVVAMLGDMLNGALNHSAEAAQINTLFAQFYQAGHAIAQFFRNLSALAPLRIYTATGNHPRFQNQHRTPTDNRYSNFDSFLYVYVEALLAGIKTIKFNINKQPSALFDVQGFHFMATHGDNLRGGDKALGVPAHAVGRTVSATTQNFSAAKKPIPNYFLVGHLHRSLNLPIASGEFLTNGGFPGTDGYALAESFNLSKPSQRLFFVHKKFGKTASYNIRLDFGDALAHGYSLPEDFKCQ